MYDQDVSGDGLHSIQKVIEPPRETSRPVIKYVLIGVSVLFLFVMLILPLIVVVVNALSDGWAAYQEAVLDEYTVKALMLTLLATVTAVAVNTIFGVFSAYLLKFYIKILRVDGAFVRRFVYNMIGAEHRLLFIIQIILL